MATLSSLLPAPAHVEDAHHQQQQQPHLLTTQRQQQSKQEKEFVSKASASLSIAKRGAPPYGQRKGWIPKGQEDYGDGGALWVAEGSLTRVQTHSGGC